MAKIANSCILQCVKNPACKIALRNNEKVFLGRGEETSIVDTMLSRKQVAATANYDTREVTIETLGRNFCGCNGYALRKGQTYTLKHGDRLELLIGNHQFDVMFEPPFNEDNKEDKDKNDVKRSKLDFPIFSAAKNVVKTEDTKIEAGEDFGTWETVDNGALLIYTYLEVKSQSKIAAFDLDGTLIRTKSGARFAKDSDDCTLNFPEVKSKLHSLNNEGYKIVIFTNQGGVKLDSHKRKEFKEKAESVLKCIKVPIQLFAATTYSVYRKPIPGMWRTLCDEKNDNVKVDIDNSFYVGDAAGRKKNWAPKKNKDHSIADRLFALNIGLKFYTPEEYFFGARPVPHITPKFDPKNIPTTSTKPSFNNKCEVIIMVGSPGSGKSHYVREHLLTKGYVHVNRDTLGSWQNCIKLLEKTIQKQQSVVIDNTNGEKVTRKKYIDAAKKHNVNCRCFVMTTSWQHSKHNNKFRELTDTAHEPIGEMILNMYKKNYQEPSLEEGFDEIVNIDFVPEFHNDNHKKLYEMFLLDH
ncbi:hypothetical protein RN001_005043 [Aquatica leii]|uniref:PNK FHA domain-containing protein n=1 Tax=Aquatica leii TaxID=1421715 RepID=A0AAN7PC33_9COLE|nr:hypothetical protein RN001_005043 [Aquatica leii]